MKQQPKGSLEYYILKKFWKFYLKYSHNLSPMFFKPRRLGYHITPLQIVDMAKEIHPDLRIAIDIYSLTIFFRNSNSLYWLWLILSLSNIAKDFVFVFFSVVFKLVNCHAIYSTCFFISIYLLISLI